MKETIKFERCCGGFCAQYVERGMIRDLEVYQPTGKEWDEYMDLNDKGQDGETAKRRTQWWLKALKKALERWVRWGWLTAEEAAAELKKFMDAHPELEEPIDVAGEFEELRKRVLAPVEAER